MIDIPDFILLKDDEGNIICPKCTKKENECTCISIEESRIQDRLATITTQKCKKGKIVTIIQNLHPDKDFVKSLTKECKTHMGTGGDYTLEDSQGCITLQGDQVESVKSLLTKKNIPYK